MKSIVLILTITMSNGVTTTRTWSYDTAAECTERVERIMKYEYPFKLRAACATVVPEISEED